MGFPCGSAGKESACNMGDLVRSLSWEDSPGEGKGYPLQCSGLENYMFSILGASLIAQLVKNPSAMQEIPDPWVRKIGWRRDRLPTPFWPGVHGVAKSLT